MSQMVKIRDVKKLQANIENGPIIRNIWWFSRNCFSCYVDTVDAVNNVDLGCVQNVENEGYESD